MPLNGSFYRLAHLVPLMDTDLEYGSFLSDFMSVSFGLIYPMSKAKFEIVGSFFYILLSPFRFLGRSTAVT
jgi:hypothetical protein